MAQNHKKTAASFNLLLPGLGHLYVLKPWRAMILFLAFVLVLTLTRYSALALVVAILAAIESYRNGDGKNRGASFSRQRYAYFIVIGVLGFVFWFPGVVVGWVQLLRVTLP